MRLYTLGLTGFQDPSCKIISEKKKLSSMLEIWRRKKEKAKPKLKLTMKMGIRQKQKCKIQAIKILRKAKLCSLYAKIKNNKHT